MYPTNIGTNKWRFTFPINITGEGAEDAIFDEIGEKLKYGGLRGVQSDAFYEKYVGHFQGSSSANDVSYLKGGTSGVSTPYKRSGIAFGEDEANEHIVIEYNGNGGGTGNYLAVHSNYSGWTQIGGGINYIPDGGRTHFGSSSNPSQKVRVNGSFYASSGSIGSDDRIKYNETDVVDALTIITKLKPQKYEKIMTYPIELSDSWIPTDEEWEGVKNADEPPYTGFEHGEEYGFIAQDVRNIPELSFLVTGEENDENGNQTTLGLNYEGIFTVAVKAIQELKAKNEALEARISALENN